MFQKLGKVTGTICLAAIPVKASDNKTPTKATVTDELSHYKCKPSDLPIYTPLHAYDKKTKPPHSEDSAFRQTLESGIRAVRVEVFKVGDVLSSQKKSVSDFVATGREHSKFVFDYLNEPDNTLPRVGAIAIGGLSGLIFSLRGGFFRRVLYTTVGAGAIASICYPKEAGKYAQQTLTEAKKVANIGYNFAMGVKPGDDVNSIDWPKFPTNLSEISDSLSDVVKSAKDTLFAPKK